MLTITTKGNEFYDEASEKFVTQNQKTVDLEHSLVSLSKWESKFKKAFLGIEEKTPEEIIEYVYMMILTPNVDQSILFEFSEENYQQIKDYIDSPQTATTFNEINQRKGRSEIITSEIIYFWMISFNVPFVCENWHLNRLLTLIRVCNAKNSKQKKMSKSQIAQRNRELNAQRRAQSGSSG